ncbi:MAG: serine/threonine-protein kinase [Gemmataceae bacterium]
MPPPTTSDALLEVIRRSGLVDEASLRTHLASRPLPAEPCECLEGLVEAGLVTGYQARLLLRGQAERFLIGDFKVQRPLGEGGMGKVYLAERRSQPQRVAIKLLRRDQAHDEAARERFTREARAVVVMDHPNIVRIHEIHTRDASPYVVLEYVEGESLQQVLDREGKLPYPRAVTYALQVARGLEHAHDRGVVHRDVKPENLRVTGDGVVKILDLGLARFIEDEEDAHAERQYGRVVVGSPDFVAPEQVRRRLDPRSDIYGLGATLYTLLVGRAPFAGLSRAEKLLAHAMWPAEPPHRLDPAIPAGLSACVMRMMAKEPDQRHATFAEVIEALSPWAKQAGARPPRRWLVVAAAFAAAVAAAWGTWCAL